MPVLTCPVCAHAQEEPMPELACRWSYVCSGCASRITPVKGDCCVFCSYSDTPCEYRVE
ncbi:MAG TPA: GDCCVxC domain-containing (seleno)protein [Acidimicrobiales bacterium]|nr:GDCCVxC domain-containing (seleno)protein [Acidimicrobiales bacterium]